MRQLRGVDLRAGEQRVDHPEFGPLRLDCDTLLVPDTDQTVLVYSAAPGSREAAALDLLRVAGTQRFTAAQPEADFTRIYPFVAE